MTEPSHTRPGLGQWLLLLVMSTWLAAVPLLVSAALSALTGRPPDFLLQLELAAPTTPALQEWAFGLVVTALTLSLHLLAFVPFFLTARQPGREFLQTAAALLIAISLYQALNALVILLCPDDCLVAIAVRLALALPFLLLCLGWVEARHHDRSFVKAWRRVGLRLWLHPAAIWLALGVAAVIVWPWVVGGSLGSTGTTAASVLRALPGALGEEILFRGFALAWLWRAARSRTGGAAASLILCIAAQGGAVLPYGDWSALLRFIEAALLGFLTIELTVRAGGSLWPAVVVHFLYGWFHFAFVDPRSREEILHWLAQAWQPLAAGGMGFLLWLGRKTVRLLGGSSPPRRGLAGLVSSVSTAGISWAVVLVLYVTVGVPGFHPDGFLIFLEEQADLGSAAAIADPVGRRAWVLRSLVETAERSQAPLRAELERRGVSYRPHYLINMIEVQERPGLRRAFATYSGVASVLFQPGMRRYAHPFQLPAVDPRGPRGVEWNVRAVGADRLWEQGYTGQDLLVGNADTGVDWAHPALKNAYLGWDGRSVDHNYHWYDPWDGSVEAWDDSGHGTHTTGTMVGLDGENRIGLAPGARWIACRNMRHGIGNPGSYLSCMEFLLAPFPLEGDPFHDGDPSRGAHVVNNSWGCPKEEGCPPDTLRLAVENLRAAGQMMVTGAGNEGPACGTVQDPLAIYDAALSVGAIGPGDRALGFSSRGPVTADGSQRLKPDLVAPGVDIRSSVPDGYANLPGTSMAGPHVTGAVALLWSVDPALIGNVDQTEVLLTETAQRLTVDAICSGDVGGLDTVCTCGGDSLDSVPNNTYGWGRVDVWAAAQSLLKGR
jgi:hypothetical protein